MGYRDRNADLVEINATFICTGPVSFLMEDSDGKQHWLPRTQCTLDPARPDRDADVTISMPEWLATKEGLV